MRQLELFDDPVTPGMAASAQDRRLGAASPDPDLVRLADRLDPRLRLGTSSWSFPGWVGLVYAGQVAALSLSRRGLAAYSAHPLLRTVAVDSGFYAPLDAVRLAGYAAQTPFGFRFLVKAPALVTDSVRRDDRGRPREPNPEFLNAARAADVAAAPFAEGLGERAGVLLFQFPPLGRRIADAPRRFAENLYRFLNRLPAGPRYAVEVRDRGLLTPDLAAALHHGGAVASFAVHPRLPSLSVQAELLLGDVERPVPGPLVLRWLLRANRSYEEARVLYEPFNRLVEPDFEIRAAVARLVSDALRAGRDVFVIANNKAEGSAPLTLFALAEEVAGGWRRSDADMGPG